MTAKRSVLFLCTGNSARSQMAEALLRHLAGDRFEVFSAGLEPHGLHPLTISVMDEIGIDVRGQYSKSIDEYLGRKTIHIAVFVCASAERACPHIYPFALTVMSWPFDDPSAATGSDEDKLGKFRDARDRIETRIRQWLASV